MSALIKPYISVDTMGTKAGAVTAVEMKPTSSKKEPERTVNLNRPFVYMIMDTENHLPIFAGALMDVK